MNGIYKINFKGIIGSLATVGILSIGVTFLSVEDNLSQGEIEGLGSRWARAFQEIIPSEGEGRASQSLSFRGYESFKAIAEFSDGSPGEKILGQGFGATIALGEAWILGGIFGEASGEVEFDELLIIHNGYFLILVKFGIIGFLLYLYFILSWIRISRRYRSSAYDDEMFHRLIVSISLAIFMYTVVVSGLFNKSSFGTLLIIIGALLCMCFKRNISFVSKEEHRSKLISRQIKSQQGG